MAFIEESKKKAKVAITNASLPALVKVNTAATNVFVKGTPEYERNQIDLQNYGRDAVRFFNSEKGAMQDLNSAKQAEQNAIDENSATSLEKRDAFFKTAFGSSPAAKAIGRFAIENIYSNGKEDKEFATTNTPNHRAMVLEASGLGMTSYNMDLLGGAKNKADFDFYLQTLQTDKEFMSTSRLLTKNENLAAGITGAMADPTYLAYAPAGIFKGLTAGLRLAGTVGANSALQYTLSQARTYGSPDRTVYDTALDVAFGGIVDSALAMRQLKKIDEFNSAKSIEEASALHTQARDTHATVNDIKPDQFNFSQTYSWRTEKEVGTKTKSLEEMVASREKAAPKERLSAEDISKAKTLADEEVKAFKLTKEAEIASQIAKSGLSKEEFMKVYDNLGTDVKEIRQIIKDAVHSGEKGIRNTINDIRPIIEHIGKVSPSAKASLEAEVMNVLGLSYKQPKLVMKDGKTIAMAKGKKSFESNIKAFNKALSGHVKSAKAKLAKLGEKAKPLKPLGKDTGGLSSKESKTLKSTQAKMDEITAKITQLSKAGADEAKITKLLDEHAKLTDIESGLLIKTENFRATRESTVVSSLMKQKELYASMANVMDEVLHEMKTVFNDIFKDGLPTRAEREIFIKEASEDMSDLLGQEIKLSFKNGEIVVENELKIDFKDGYAYHNGKKIMLAATFIAVVGSSSAMADDGSSTVMSYAPLYLVMLGLGIYGLNAMRNHGGILQSLQSGAKKVAGIEKMAIFQSSDKGKALNDAKNTIVDRANFEAINSIQVVMNNGTELSKSLAQRLGFDAVNPQKILNAMVNRMVLIRDDMRAFRDAEEINYKQWLVESDIQETRFDKLLNAGAETANRERFLDEVTEYIEFGKGESAAVKAQAEVWSKRVNDTFERAVANKLIGFTDSAKKVANYIPRIPKYDDIISIISAGGRDSLVEEFAKAIAKGRGTTLAHTTDEELIEVNKIRTLAASMVDGYATVGVRGTNPTRIDDIIKAMESLGYDVKGLDATEIATSVRTNNDAISRGKFRIEMDFSEFTSFKLNNGQDVSYSSVFERNSGTLLQTYSSQVNGMISMKRSTKGMEIIDEAGNAKILEDGVDTEYALEQIIMKEPNPRVRDVLTTYKDSVLGHPLYDITTDASRTVSVLRDLAYSRLALTQFAMASEYATAVRNMLSSNQALVQGLGNIRNIIRNIMGEESVNTALSNTITRLTGLGSSVSRRETSFKNLEGMYNVVDDSTKTGAEKVAAFVKYVSLVASRILHADDAMKRISGIANTERLDKFLNGKYEMSANRLERLGIDDEFKSMFTGAFERDAKGNLVDEFDANWTDDMKDRYANVMHRMIMTDSPESIVSSLPHITTTDNAGRLVGFMTAFTAQSYTTKALQGLRRPDMRSAVETTIYFLGTYAGMYGRDIVTGKHKDTDEYYNDLMFKSITMMPLTAPYGMLSMMSDPMTTSVAGDSIQQMSKIGHDLSE